MKRYYRENRVLSNEKLKQDIEVTTGGSAYSKDAYGNLRRLDTLRLGIGLAICGLRGEQVLLFPNGRFKVFENGGERR